MCLSASTTGLVTSIEFYRLLQNRCAGFLRQVSQIQPNFGRVIVRQHLPFKIKHDGVAHMGIT